MHICAHRSTAMRGRIADRIGRRCQELFGDTQRARSNKPQKATNRHVVHARVGSATRFCSARAVMELLSTPGVCGLLSLPAVAGVGYAFASWYVDRLGGLHPLGKVARNSVMLSAMAGFYWLWAIYKFLVKGDADFGVFSFAVAFAGTCLLYTSPSPRDS